jgi:lysophospholipase L1-like esterase
MDVPTTIRSVRIGLLVVVAAGCPGVLACAPADSREPGADTSESGSSDGGTSSLDSGPLPGTASSEGDSAPVPTTTTADTADDTSGSTDTGADDSTGIDFGPLVNVTCVGDSITAGAGASAGHDYPTLLGQLLGRSVTTMNFGHGGATLLQAGDLPYWTQAEFGGSTTFAGTGPGAVILMLGTNDSKPQNWTRANQAAFLDDCVALVDNYASLPDAPRVWINLPPPAMDNGFGISGTIIHESIEPLLVQCAAATNSGTIDVYSAMLPHPEYFPDGVHPDDTGAALLAQTVYDALAAAYRL